MTDEELRITRLMLASASEAWRKRLDETVMAPPTMRQCLRELWCAVEALAILLAHQRDSPDDPHVVLGLTGRARKPADGVGGSAGPQGPASGTGGSTGLREDFLEL